MQIRPHHHVLAGRQHRGQVQPAQHAAEAHFDTDQLEVPVGGRGQHHVGDAGQPLADDIDDLGVQHVPHQQDLLVGQRLGEVVDHIALGAGGVDAQHQLVPPDVGHRFPWKQQQRAAPRFTTTRSTRCGPESSTRSAVRSTSRPMTRPSGPNTSCPVTRLRNSTHEACRIPRPRRENPV